MGREGQLSDSSGGGGRSETLAKAFFCPISAHARANPTAETKNRRVPSQLATSASTEGIASAASQQCASARAPPSRGAARTTLSCPLLSSRRHTMALSFFKPKFDSLASLLEARACVLLRRAQREKSDGDCARALQVQVLSSSSPPPRQCTHTKTRTTGGQGRAVPPQHAPHLHHRPQQQRCGDAQGPARVGHERECFFLFVRCACVETRSARVRPINYQQMHASAHRTRRQRGRARAAEGVTPSLFWRLSAPPPKTQSINLQQHTQTKIHRWPASTSASATRCVLCLAASAVSAPPPPSPPPPRLFDFNTNKPNTKNPGKKIK